MSLDEDGEQREPLYTLVGIWMDAATVENSLEAPQKIKKSHYHVNPAIPLLGINPKEMKSVSWKDSYTPMSVVAIFTVAKIWKQCKSPWASQAALVAKNPPGEAGGVRDVGSVPGSGSSPGGGNGNHASILDWRIPRTEETGGLQSMESQSRTRLKRLSTSTESIGGQMDKENVVKKYYSAYSL